MEKKKVNKTAAKSRTETVSIRTEGRSVERRKFLVEAARVVAGAVGGFALISMAKIDSVLGADKPAEKSIRRKVLKTLRLKRIRDREVQEELLAQVKTEGDPAAGCHCACSYACTCSCECQCTCNCNCECGCPCDCGCTCTPAEVNFEVINYLEEQMNNKVSMTADGDQGGPKAFTSHLNLWSDWGNNISGNSVRPRSLEQSNKWKAKWEGVHTPAEGSQVPVVSGAGLAATAVVMGTAAAWRLLKDQAAEQDKA